MLLRLTFFTLFNGSLGFLTHLVLLNQKIVGRGYFIYHGLGAVGASALAFYLYPTPAALVVPFGVIALVACLLAGIRVAVSRTLLIVSVAIGTAILWNALSLPTLDSPYLPMLTTLLSCALLGHTVGALCLGHWYLNQPGLPIEPLRQATQVLLVVLMFRVVFGLYWGADVLVSNTGLRWLTSSTAGIFWMMRMAWGLVAPAVLSYFLWQTVRLASTQSATGLLYVMVVMVLIGEIVSVYLLSVHGIHS